MWASSRRDSTWFCGRTRSHINWYFLRFTVRHKRCSASGTKLRTNARAAPSIPACPEELAPLAA